MGSGVAGNSSSSLAVLVRSQRYIELAILAAAFAVGGCGSDTQADDESQVRDAVKEFGARYLAGDGDAACALMTDDFQRRYASESAKAFQVDPNSPGLGDCARWVKFEAAARYGQISLDEPPNAQQGKRRQQRDLARLESAELKGLKVSGDQASASRAPGFGHATISLVDVDDEWMVDGLGSSPPEVHVSASATQSDGSDLIECDADAATVRLATPPDTIDRVTPGWRRVDGAIRVRFVSKSDSDIVEGDRTCGGEVTWSRVELSLGDFSDETTRFGINRSFRHLPGTIRFFVDAGDGEFDEIRGYNGSDRLDGGPGEDELRGYGGRDRIIGGPGADELFAGGQADVIEAADGRRDQVVCGYGKDLAYVDAIDKYGGDCEDVRVSAAGA
jgi:RTX calcium-binding nonapeptide repeat (4 copies)